MTLVALFSLLCAAGLVRGQQENIAFCGNAPYYPSEYTCYGTTLCPRLDGQPTLPCGGACYSPDMYQCRDGQLQLLPAADANSPPFKLEVHSSNPDLNLRQAEVCNLQFHVGADAQTCVYCYNAPPQYVCSSYQNKTVLLASGSMSVDVPGGQVWFVDPEDGRLRTTAGGKGGGSDREHAGEGVTIYQEGYFACDGSSHWLACKEPGQGETYSIYAGTVDRTDCERIKLVVVPSTDHKEGAYSYT
ncbi:Endo-1,3(4)-beta-glucanase 1 carbohydrate binding domain-containing protein [Madurella fahalii]|uniref:Endo-1,3(4)-beta-glucanase 1 carbohydrate binding domain-containing protein n=1 Tax=Madurella fahalii TaxID=1157608 RepID=A0ABQ0G546_9PEZI